MMKSGVLQKGKCCTISWVNERVRGYQCGVKAPAWYNECQACAMGNKWEN